MRYTIDIQQRCALYLCYLPVAESKCGKSASLEITLQAETRWTNKKNCAESKKFYFLFESDNGPFADQSCCTCFDVCTPISWFQSIVFVAVKNDCAAIGRREQNTQ